MASFSNVQQPYIIQYSRAQLLQLRPFASFPFAEYILPPDIYAPDWPSQPVPSSPSASTGPSEATAAAAAVGSASAADDRPTVEQVFPPDSPTSGPATRKKVPGAQALRAGGIPPPVVEVQVGIAVKPRAPGSGSPVASSSPTDVRALAVARTAPAPVAVKLPSFPARVDTAPAREPLTPHVPWEAKTEDLLVQSLSGMSVAESPVTGMSIAGGKTRPSRVPREPRLDVAASRVKEPGEESRPGAGADADEDKKTQQAGLSPTKRLIHGALGLPTPRTSPRSSSRSDAGPASPVAARATTAVDLPTPDTSPDTADKTSQRRKASGGAPRAEKPAPFVREVPKVERLATEDELDAKILRIRAENRRLEEQQSKVDRDVLDHSPTKTSGFPEHTEILFEQERERNRLRKLQGQGQREWDNEKSTPSSSSSLTRPHASTRRASAPFAEERESAGLTPGSPAAKKDGKPAPKGRAVSSSAALERSAAVRASGSPKAQKGKAGKGGGGETRAVARDSAGQAT